MLINCKGAFCVKNKSGDDITPPLKKAQALLAILALSEGHKVSRQLITDRLWQDRAPEQAKVSLRGTLYALRKKAVEFKNYVKSDQTYIWLSQDVQINSHSPSEQPLLVTPVIRGTNYKDWLNALRFQKDGHLPQGPRNIAVPACHDSGAVRDIFFIQLARSDTHEHSFLNKYVADKLAKTLVDLGQVQIEECDISTFEGKNLHELNARPVVLIELESLLFQRQLVVSIRVFSGHRRQFVFSERLRMPADLTEIFDGYQLAEFVHKVSGALSRMRWTDSGGSAAQINAAVTRIFTLNKDDMALADRILSAIEHRDQTGLIPAWQSFAALFKTFESLEKDAYETQLMQKYAQIAESRLHENATALALVARFHLSEFGDRERGLWLADRAMQVNSQNPYVLTAALCAALLRDKTEYAVELGKGASALTKTWPHHYYFEQGVAMAALAHRDINTALRMFENVFATTKKLRVNLRYLVAAQILRRNEKMAQTYVNELCKFEPDFSPSTLLRTDYPVNTLRQTGLIESIERALR